MKMGKKMSESSLECCRPVLLMWIPVSFVICSALQFSLHDKGTRITKGIHRSPGNRTHRPHHRGIPRSVFPPSVRCVFEEILSPFTPVFAPSPIGAWGNIGRAASPYQLNALPLVSPHSPRFFFFFFFICTGFVCLLWRVFFSDSFPGKHPVAWTTNLQPTGVVTAVKDNGQTKLCPRFWNVYCHHRRLAANIICHIFCERERKWLDLLILFWRITSLTF